MKYKNSLSKWQKELHGRGWNALFIENHDIPRVVSRCCHKPEYTLLAAKAFALTYFMQKGTPFIYQGQEIGMTNVKFDSIDMYDDIQGINLYKERIEKGMSEKEAIEIVYRHSRDNARTPMQWDSGKYADFSKFKPWLNLNKNYKNINVASQLNDDNSVLNFYKKLIKIKKNSKTLIYGAYKLLLPKSKTIFAYERELEGEKYIIVANLSSEKIKTSLNSLDLAKFDCILTNYQNNFNGYLEPWECRLYKLKNK